MNNAGSEHDLALGRKYPLTAYKTAAHLITCLFLKGWFTVAVRNVLL